ncbi:MAG: hypothetical protein ACREPN_03835 [Rudaea sp.]
MIRLIAAATFCLLLTACVETRFESTPGDVNTTCDARWKGLWTEGNTKNDDGAIYVDDECHWIVLDRPKPHAPLNRIQVPMQYAHIDGKDYLIVADTALKDLVKLEPPYSIEPAPAQSYYLVFYQLRGDSVELTQVNSERVAQLILEGKLEGTISKTANELHVFVRGDRARILEIVRKFPIFDSQKPTHFVRRHQTLDEFERVAAPAPAKKAP